MVIKSNKLSITASFVAELNDFKLSATDFNLSRDYLNVDIDQINFVDYFNLMSPNLLLNLCMIKLDYTLIIFY